MTDRKVFEAEPTEAGGRERDGQAEALLVDGLDRYFGGRYEDAIHLWTRVLFLDRAHPRARAYIDRARTALAERQRHAEEMLHTTGELLSRGQTDEARDLLAQAVEASADDEQAATLRWRIERVERARVMPGAHSPAAIADAVPVRAWVARPRRRVLLWVAGALGLLVVAAAGSATVQEWVSVGPPPPLPVAEQSAAVPVLSSAEAALVRARMFVARGRLAEALRVLDRVGPDSADRPAADRLRVEIQEILLATRRGALPARVGSGGGQP